MPEREFITTTLLQRCKITGDIISLKRNNKFCKHSPHIPIFVSTAIDILLGDLIPALYMRYRIKQIREYEKAREETFDGVVTHPDGSFHAVYKAAKFNSELTRDNFNAHNIVSGVATMAIMIVVNLGIGQIVTRVCRDDVIESNFHTSKCHQCDYWSSISFGHKANLINYNRGQEDQPSIAFDPRTTALSVYPIHDRGCLAGHHYKNGGGNDMSEVDYCARYYCEHEQDIQGAQAVATAAVISQVLDQLFSIFIRDGCSHVDDPNCFLKDVVQSAFFTFVGDYTAGYTFGTQQDCRFGYEAHYLAGSCMAPD